MRNKYLYILLFFVFLTVSCSNKKYDNGNYCAEVEYYNPRTGTHSTYTLGIKIEDDKLTTIFFPRGGVMGENHFLPPKIHNGKASFKNDRGYEYSVTILKKGKCK
jgi:hypothetical protein